jgi:hypothetical protein
LDILIFRKNRGEDLKIFLKEYKRICIGIGFRIVIEWLNFCFEFLEGIIAH